MKKGLYLVLVAALYLTTGCEKIDIAEDTSSCVKKSTIKFAESSACKDGGSVKEYLFQNKLVYVLDPGNCGADMSAAVIDADCKPLGALGGFIGNTTINGESFTKAEYKRTIWED